MASVEQTDQSVKELLGVASKSFGRVRSAILMGTQPMRQVDLLSQCDPKAQTEILLALLGANPMVVPTVLSVYFQQDQDGALKALVSLNDQAVSVALEMILRDAEMNGKLQDALYERKDSLGGAASLGASIDEALRDEWTAVGEGIQLLGEQGIGGDVTSASSEEVAETPTSAETADWSWEDIEWKVNKSRGAETGNLTVFSRNNKGARIVHDKLRARYVNAYLSDGTCLVGVNSRPLEAWEVLELYRSLLMYADEGGSIAWVEGILYMRWASPPAFPTNWLVRVMSGKTDSEEMEFTGKRYEQMSSFGVPSSGFHVEVRKVTHWEDAPSCFVMNVKVHQAGNRDTPRNG